MSVKDIDAVNLLPDVSGGAVNLRRCGFVDYCSIELADRTSSIFGGQRRQQYSKSSRTKYRSPDPWVVEVVVGLVQ